MPWANDKDARQHTARTYGTDWRKARALALRRAGGKCEHPGATGRPCGSTDHVQVDHVKPVSQGGTHHLDNLRVLCRAHHLAKTAQEGKGYRAAGRQGKGFRRQAEDPSLTRRTQW